MDSAATGYCFMCIFSLDIQQIVWFGLMFSSGADEVVDLLASCPEIAILSMPFDKTPDPLGLEEEPHLLIALLGLFRVSVGERQQDVSAMFRLFVFSRELDSSIDLPN